MRLNGTGIYLLGVNPSEQPRTRFATMWFTVLYLPIFPLWRGEIQPVRHSGNSFDYHVLRKTPLDWSEIFKTYVFSWVLVPAVGVTPALLAIPEIHQALGIPEFMGIPMRIFALLWVSFLSWRLVDWNKNRWYDQSL